MKRLLPLLGTFALSTYGVALLPTQLQTDHLVEPEKITGTFTELNYTIPKYTERLFDGEVGTTDVLSWEHSDNPWDERQYAMSAVLDLGRPRELLELRYYVGNMPDFVNAALSIYTRADPNLSWTLVGVASGGATAWNKWHSVAFEKGTRARYVKLSFDKKEQRFNISEIELVAAPEPEPYDARIVVMDVAPSVRGPRVKKPTEYVRAIADPNLVP